MKRNAKGRPQAALPYVRDFYWMQNYGPRLQNSRNSAN